MSSKLLVLALPPNLSHDMFITAFADFRGFLNGSLHLNPQNELYGIVEFSSIEFADIARKVRSGFKFMNSRQPINIEFFKPHETFGYQPASNQGPNIGNYGNPSSTNIGYNQPQMMSQSNFANQNPIKIDHPPSDYYSQNQPSRSSDLEGRGVNQGMFIPQQQQQLNYQPHSQQPHYSQENTLSGADRYSAQPQNAPINYNTYQGAPNQYLPQQGISQGAQNIKGNLQSPNLHVGLNFPTSPINMTANPNIQRGFPSNPSNITNLPQPQSQPQTIAPNFGYAPPNQQNINRQGGFGPSPQAGPSFGQPQKVGDIRNMTNLINKVGSPNFPQKPLDMKDEEIAMFKVPPKATSSIYVDGVPGDATEREVSHVFRPFPGYIEVRLIKKETKVGRPFYLCFVDFENPLQATIALHTLQGYRFDKNDKVGLKISYAFHSHEPTPSQHHAPKLKITKRKT